MAMRKGKAARRAATRRATPAGVPPPGVETGRQRGLWEGYRTGYGEAQLRSTLMPPTARYDLHVAFIVEGLFAVKEGIESGLGALVRQVTVLAPDAEAIVRIRELQPDLVLVLNGIHAFGADLSRELKTTGVTTAIWFVDDPYFSDDSAQIAPYYDHVFTHEMSIIPFYSDLGVSELHYLPLAASPRIFRSQRVGPAYHSDVCFIGTGFWNRIAFFDALIPLLPGRRIVLIGGLWDRLQHFPTVAPWARLAGVSIEESALYYSGASLVLNMHRSAEDVMHNRNSQGLPAYSVNPRTFEIAACGAMQLTDVRQDLDSFFTPGREIETYTSPEDLAGKIAYYLEHVEERQRIARGGLYRSKAYTYRNRLQQMLITIFPELSLFDYTK
jgi:spore maturation protein CgeB